MKLFCSILFLSLNLFVSGQIQCASFADINRSYTDSCDRQCVCTQTVFQSFEVKCFYEREEITCMSNERRQRYIQTYLTISNPTHRLYNNFSDLVQRHGNGIPTIHTTQYFLPWHRKFLFEFEKLLQEVDCKVTNPYWDFMLHPENPYAYPPFDQQFFGGNGSGSNNCVMDGPFAYPNWMPPLEPTCLSRILRSPSLLPTAAQANIAFTTTSPSFIATEFAQFITKYVLLSDQLESTQHNNIHSSLQGTMLTDPSPKDPFFFAMHANIDRLWNIWQKMSYANMNAYSFPDVPMPFMLENTKPSDVYSLDSLGVRYVFTKIAEANSMPLLCSYVKLNNGWYLISDLEERIIKAPFDNIKNITQTEPRAVPTLLRTGTLTSDTYNDGFKLQTQLQKIVTTDMLLGIDLNQVVTNLNLQPVCPVTSFSCGNTDSTVAQSLTTASISVGQTSLNSVVTLPPTPFTTISNIAPASSTLFNPAINLPSTSFAQMPNNVPTFNTVFNPSLNLPSSSFAQMPNNVPVFSTIFNHIPSFKRRRVRRKFVG